ncbi:arylsulfatase B-like [Dermacentor variabilis]|uniref:arylsulfatase B-like n=1 Tax=Dermacentor variabilis TaxID=34621 RepID=UPI003F5BFF74
MCNHALVAAFSSKRDAAAVVLLLPALLLPTLPVVFSSNPPPDIVVFFADDMGWDDTSFHGSSQIPTPNLDALAADGIILNNFYVQPACTPSRSAFMTGRYPIRTGTQGYPLEVGEPWGLPSDVKILPEYLRELGYETHLVGKWHLGCYMESLTPTYRGFDSFYGFYYGEEDYYSHNATYKNHTGLDFWFNTEPRWRDSGRYSTTLFTERAQEIIRNRRKPLFLYVSYQAPHGSGGPEPLQAPAQNVIKFPYIGETQRTLYAGMVDTVDQSVGQVFQTLQEVGMLDNVVVLFSSDNGGTPYGDHSTRSFNWPLRGLKMSVWEGSTRVPAFVWSTLLKQRQGVSNQLMHLTDWFTTFYRVAGGNVSNLENMDGLDMWDYLSNGTGSARTELVYNIEPLEPQESSVAAIRDTQYKLVLDPTGADNDRYRTTGGRRPFNDLDELLARSKAAEALRRFYNTDSLTFPKDWRQRATLTCGDNTTENFSPDDKVFLFDIAKDPCELNNLAEEHPDIVSTLKKRLDYYRSVATPSLNKPVDPASFPENHNGTWAPWVESS